MKIPIVLSTGSLFNFDVDTTMALAREAGFDGIELMIDGRRETYSPKHLETLVDRHELPILAVHSPFVQSFLLDWPVDPVDSIKKSVELAETLNARIVVVHPPGRWLRLQAVVATPLISRKLSLPLPVVRPGRLGHWLENELADYQAGTHVKIAIENMPCRWLGPFRLEPHHNSEPGDLNRFEHLTLDTTHVGTRYLDLLEFHDQIGPHVSHIHLSNFDGKQHRLPHQGELPLAAFLRRVCRMQYQGLISLELNPTSLQAENEIKLKRNLKTSLTFCQQELCME